MVKDYLNPINGKLTDDVNMFSGGLNTYQDKAFINPDQTPYSINMTMYKPPMVSTRPSRENLFLNTKADTTINSMWAYDENLLVFTRTSAEALNPQDLCSAEYIAGTGWDVRTYRGIPTNKQVYYTYCRTAEKEYVYVGNELCKIKLTRSTNPAYPFITDVMDDHFGIPCWHKGRLFLADPSTGRITFSALNDFDNFEDFPDLSTPTTLGSAIAIADGSSTGAPADSGAYDTGEYNITLNGNELLPSNRTFYYDAIEEKFIFDVGTQLVYNDDDDVWEVKMLDYSSYAGDFLVTNAKGKIRMITSFDDKLVIFCEHSIHLLYGDTPLTSSAYQFQLVDFTLNLGCQAPKTVAVSGSYLFWMGDDREIYSFSGSSLDMISRPNASRYVNRNGSISNLEIPEGTFLGIDGDIDAIATASSSKYYIQFPVIVHGAAEEEDTVRFPLFVYDIYNKIWWAEDGDITSLANFSVKKDHIVMYKEEYGAILKTTNKYTGVDYLYNPETGENDLEVLIQYEFHSRVYAADGVNSRKTLSKIWVQASANCEVYITDSWLSSDAWSGPFPAESLKKIGELGARGTKEMTEDYLKTYDPLDYEQQYCIVPKMYGERLNTFQIIIRGSGASKFYLMKREWSAR